MSFDDETLARLSEWLEDELSGLDEAEQARALASDPGLVKLAQELRSSVIAFNGNVKIEFVRRLVFAA